VGEESAHCDAAAQEVVRLAVARDGEGFVAVEPEDRQRFWADRSRTAAIARHTNAFKINEDIVIPLEKLAEYNRGVERINIEQSLKNKIFIAESFISQLSAENFPKNLPGSRHQSNEENRIVTDKRQAALHLLQDTLQRWQTLLTHFDTLAQDAPWAKLPAATKIADSGESLIELMLRGAIRVSFRKDVRDPLRELFSGEHWSLLQTNLDHVHRTGRAKRIFIALHMHAGDGNVHTNIPVNSNDYEMLREAERIVDHIMELAQKLGGKISGEHGIGMTKFSHLDQAIIDAFVVYKKQVDPHHRFNKGKLMPQGMFFVEPVMDRAYTPSLRLVQQEAIILEESAVGGLNDAIRKCLRCGKCKEVCTTHVPEGGLFYSPRNKILALGLAIEAFLYEEQTRRGLSRRNMEQFADLADHCAVCHRCQVPCPVRIDFGLVTVALRGIQAEHDRPWSHLNYRIALSFLNMKRPRWIRYFRRFFLAPAYNVQRSTSLIINKKNALQWVIDKAQNHPAFRHLASTTQSMLQTRLPKPSQGGTSRTLLGWDEIQGIPWIPVNSPPGTVNETVFYFPGCGCERLFSDIALATLALTHHLGIQTVLPPEYMCCGFPQKAGGDAKKSRIMSMENRVLLHRMANTLDFLNIKTVLVSCGTCLSQLQNYHFETIFPGCRVMDVHEFLYEKGVTTPADPTTRILFHDPCHSPMTHHSPAIVVKALTGTEVTLTDRCCSEAGTFALAHPEPANQARLGKIRVLRQAMEHPGVLGEQSSRIMTSCPSCYQGMSRIGYRMTIPTDFLVVFLARKILGDLWRPQFLAMVASQKIGPILFN
ncbi:MAG TPA: FAD-binding oxidoreductase, partial [Magnetococcales bacterium]|nr:FAD-binding oxidoreductase [Magnetococcales bacterium]